MRDRRHRLSIRDVQTLAGRSFGTSRWHMVTQEQIDRFADLTDDHHWIHVDQARAKLALGSTIAHGFLTLSMLSTLSADLVELGNDGRNYGFDRLRFVAPVRAGARIRLNATGLEARSHAKGQLLGFHCIVEIEHETAPALIADWWVLMLE